MNGECEADFALGIQRTYPFKYLVIECNCSGGRKENLGRFDIGSFTTRDCVTSH